MKKARYSVLFGYGNKLVEVIAINIYNLDTAYPNITFDYKFENMSLLDMIGEIHNSYITERIQLESDIKLEFVNVLNPVFNKISNCDNSEISGIVIDGFRELMNKVSNISPMISTSEDLGGVE